MKNCTLKYLMVMYIAMTTFGVNGLFAQTLVPEPAPLTTFPELMNDITYWVPSSPQHCKFNNAFTNWCVVGIRNSVVADNWNLYLYNDTLFFSSVAQSTYGLGTAVDFVVVDNNHTPLKYRGIRAVNTVNPGYSPGVIEFEGGTETLTVGPVQEFSWPQWDVVKMYDVQLEPGNYRFSLTNYNSNTDLGFGLFKSNSAPYYAGRSAAIASSDSPTLDGSEAFNITITSSDWYGLCVWSNQAESTQYQIEITPIVYWQGTVSSNWATASNWSNGVVPTLYTNVIINSGTPYSPVIGNGLSASCADITLGSGAFLTQNATSYLNVYGNFISDNGTFTQNGTSYLYFKGSQNTLWYDGNQNDTYTNVRIEKSSDLITHTINDNITVGSSVSIREGILIVGTIYDLTVNGTGSSAVEIQQGGTLSLSGDLDLAGGILVSDGARLSGYGDIEVEKNVRFEANALYNADIDNINFNFNGSGTQYIYDLDDNTKFGNIFINKPSGTLYLNNKDLYIKGSLYINSGVFSTTNGPSPTATYNIRILGNWNNTIGASAFVESTSTVYFEGEYAQTCSTETFHALVINKPFATHDAYIINGGNVSCASLKFESGLIIVISGQFTALDLFYNGINGNYELREGGQIDLTNSDGYVDLNGNLTILGGVFNVHGGTSMSYWPWSTNASITMSGGILDFKDQGIRINNSGFTLTENITGGTIYTAGSLASHRTDWNPVAGTFVMQGAGEASFSHVSGSSFNNLVINKTPFSPAPLSDNNPPPVSIEPSSRRDDPPQIMSEGPLLDRVTATGEIRLNGSFTLQSGIFDGPDANMYVGGNWANYAGLAAFEEVNTTVRFTGTSSADILTAEHFYYVIVEKTYAGFDGLEIFDSVSVTDNFYIGDGTVELNTGAVLHIGGNLTILSNAGLNADDAAPISIYCGKSWTDNNDSYSSTKGFKSGLHSAVIFNSPTGPGVQSIYSKNPFNKLVINSQAPYVRPHTSIDHLDCYKMDIQSGTFRLNGSKLSVLTYLDISGRLEMINTSDSIFAGWDVRWKSGSTGSITGGKIFVTYGWDFEAGSNVQIHPANLVTFHGDAISSILCGSATSSFGSILIDKPLGSPPNWVYTVGPDTMRVSGSMTIKPLSIFSVQSFNMIIDGELNILAGGEFEIWGGYVKNMHTAISPAGTLEVLGGTFFTPGRFNLPSTGILMIYLNGSFISNPPLGLVGWNQYEGRLEMNSGLLEIGNDAVWIASTFDDQISGGEIRIGGPFHAISPGTFEPTGGTVRFNPYSDPSPPYTVYNIYCSGGNFFHDLSIDGYMGLMSGIEVRNDINLLSGYLLNNNFVINLKRHWNNTVGMAAYDAYLGKVVFSSSIAQNCYGQTAFTRIEVNKPANSLFIPVGAFVQCDEYDWTAGTLTVDGGTFIADDLVDNGLFGAYQLTGAGGLLELHQDAGQVVDLSGTISIYDGTMNIYGGSSTYSLWPGNNNAILNMYDGVLDFKDKGIKLFNHPSYNLQTNITGGKIRTSGRFQVDRTDFTPGNGTIELYGDGLLPISHFSGSNFNNLLINKDITGGAIEAQSHIEVLGDLTVNQGIFFTTNYAIAAYQDVIINQDGALAVLQGSTLKMTDGDSILVNNGGELFINGSPSSYATVCSGNPSDFYHLRIRSGGLLSAAHGNFRNLASEGVYVMPGAMINPDYNFNKCLFETGTMGGNLLTIDNDQSLVVDGAIFPANTWGGQGNVKKSVNTGNVSFTNYSGGFGGELYDNDPYNRLDWYPIVSVIVEADPQEICIGGSSQLQAVVNGGMPPFTYNWSPVASLSDPDVANPLASPSATTVYSVTVTDNTMTTATAAVSVTVNPLPDVTCPDNLSVCIEEVIFLENMDVFPPSISASSVFSGPGVVPFSLPGGQYDFVALLAGPGTHTITYTYTDDNGCSNYCTFNITVNDLPVVTCPEDFAVCINEETVFLDGLSVSPPAVSAASVFSGPGVIPVNPALGFYDFDPALAGTGNHAVTYTYTDGNGCVNSCIFVITVNGIPVVECPSDFGVCNNTGPFYLETLDVSPPSNGPQSVFSGTGVTVVDPSLGWYSFNPLAAGPGDHIISYTFTDMNACSNTCTFTITVNALPLVSCPGNSAVCIDVPAYALSGGSPSGGTYSGNGVSGGSFNPAAAGAGAHIITYTYTDANNCTNTCSFTITVHDHPLAEAGADVVLFHGNTTTLNGNASGGNPPWYFSWSPSATLSDPDIPNPIASPLIPTLYTLIVSDQNGCSGTDNVYVNVLPEGTGIVSGFARYDNAALTGLSGLTVRLLQEGVPVYTTGSGSGGVYEFQGVPAGNYQVSCLSSTTYGGVNAIDAQLVLMHFVHFITLTGMPLVAANVDMIPMVNTIDALMIARRSVGLISSFPVGDWAFEDININVVAGEILIQNIQGLCFGDVNRSYTPPYKSPPQVELLASGLLPATPGSMVSIPVSTGQRMQTGAVSLFLEYPSKQMTITNVTTPFDKGTLLFNDVNGQLRIAWFCEEAVMLEEGETLLNIHAVAGKDPFDLFLTPVAQSEVADEQGITIPGCLLNYPELICHPSATPNMITVHPNPFADFTELQVGTASQAVIEGTLYNAAGMAVQQFRTEVPGAGMHRVVIDGSALAEGYYSCTLTVTEGGKTLLHRLKLVVVR